MPPTPRSDTMSYEPTLVPVERDTGRMILQIADCKWQIQSDIESALCNLTSAIPRLYPVSVADGLDMRRRGRGRARGRRPDALDDPTEIVVGDRLAVLAERDHRAVDRFDLLAGEREAERLAARLHGVAARVTPEHEARADRLPDIFRPHDLVGARVLQHAGLVNPCF